MAYSQFKTLASVKAAFELTTLEGVRFLPELPELVPSLFTIWDADRDGDGE